MSDQPLTREALGRMEDLLAQMGQIDEEIARGFNERTRLVCALLAEIKAQGRVPAETNPDAPVLSDNVIKIAEEGQLGLEGMAHMFHQLRTQVRVVALRANRTSQRQSSQGQAASA